MKSLCVLMYDDNYILLSDNASEGRQSTLDVSRDLSLPKRFQFTGLLKEVVEVFI